MQFYLKQQVVCLENKNVMQFILSKVLNEISLQVTLHVSVCILFLFVWDFHS